MYLFYSLSVLSCSLSVNSHFYNALCPTATFLLLLPFSHFISISASVCLCVEWTVVLSSMSGHVLRRPRQRSTHRCIRTHTDYTHNRLSFYFERSFLWEWKSWSWRHLSPIQCYVTAVPTTITHKHLQLLNMHGHGTHRARQPLAIIISCQACN